MENLAEYYFEKLPQDTNPGLLLAKFFCQVMETIVSKSEIIMFNRLVRLYGRTIPYFAILDVGGMDNVNMDNPFPLLAYFCKKRIEQKNPEAYNGAYNNLDAKIERLQGQIAAQENRKKLKIKELE
jgi:hypothetical protein